MQSERRVQTENRIRELRESLNELEAQLERIDRQDNKRNTVKSTIWMTTSMPWTRASTAFSCSGPRSRLTG